MKVGKHIGLFIGWAILVFLIDWLVDGSIWLSMILAGAFASISNLTMDVMYNKRLYDITDAELVRVSALANQLEEQVGELQMNLEKAESNISNLESELNHVRKHY